MSLGGSAASWVNGAVQQAQQRLFGTGSSSGGAVNNGTVQVGDLTMPTTRANPPSAPIQGPPSMPTTPDASVTSVTPGPWRSGYTTQQAANRSADDAAWNYSSLLHGGDMSNLLLQRHMLGISKDQQPQRQALDQQGLYNSYNSNMARNKLGLRGVDLDRQGLGIQRGMLGLDREGLGVSRDYIANMSGLADRALEQTLGGINRNLATDQRNTTSDYTSRGAYFTPFHRMDLADNYANALQARTEAAQQREGQQYGWDRDLANIGLDDRRIDLRYQDLGLADQRLNLEAERLGIDANDYQNALSQGLAQMGLDSQINAESLLAGMASSGQQIAALYAQIAADAAMYSGNPQIVAMLNAAVASQSPPAG